MKIDFEMNGMLLPCMIDAHVKKLGIREFADYFWTTDVENLSDSLEKLQTDEDALKMENQALREGNCVNTYIVTKSAQELLKEYVKEEQARKMMGVQLMKLGVRSIEANIDVDKPAEERIEDIRDVDPMVVPTENKGGEGRVEAVRIDVEAIIEPDVWSAEFIGGEDKVEASGNAGGTVGDASNVVMVERIQHEGVEEADYEAEGAEAEHEEVEGGEEEHEYAACGEVEHEEAEGPIDLEGEWEAGDHGDESDGF
ncbi:hypothetical protein CRG98_005411 [Punica granatum]|uniref:PB1-like domain-containing protein n=1 Tax=Punica granatum TaxID=22663 RepID=A0A2I0L0P6_PUNGR|nr:hypothetical protein CRG98_005411 [Punica granatum]